MQRSFYLTGIAAIDNQHLQLFERMDRLLTACVNGAGAQELRDIAGFLASYADTHFTEEEKLQQRCGYPDAERHHEHHVAFCRNLEFIRNEIAADRITSALVMQVNQMLIDWMTYHIATEDRRLGEFITSGSA